MEKNINKYNLNELLIRLKNGIKTNDFLTAFNVYKQLKEQNCSVKIERKEDDEDEERFEDNNIIYNNNNNNIKNENDDMNFSIFK